MRAPQQQAARGGVRRRRDLVGQTAETPRTDHPRAHAKLVAGGAGPALAEAAPAEVVQADAQLAVLVIQGRLSCGQGREDELIDLDTGSLHALRKVLNARRRGGDDVRLHLQANGGHTDRIAHALLAIDDVAAGYDVKDLPRVRDGDGARRFDGPHGVAAVHVVPRRARDRDHASRVLGADVASGDAHESRPHFEARDPLGGLDRGHDRLHGPVDIDNDTLAESIRSGLPDPDDVDAATGGHLADENADFRRTDVDGDEHRLLSHDSLRSLQWKYPLQPIFACRYSGK